MDRDADVDGDGGAEPSTGAEPVVESALELSADPQGVWAGRRLVEAGLRAHAGDAVAVTGGVVARELLANAIEHGQAPVSVRLVCLADHARIEVADGDAGPVPAGGGSAGARGLDVVARLCRGWGWDLRGEGKTVWAELGYGARPAGPEDPEMDSLLRLWLDGEAHHAERYPVRLRDVPVALLLRSQARVAALVGPETDPEVPAHLRDRLREAADGLRPVRDVLVREALAAAAYGAEKTTLTLHLTPCVAAKGEAFLEVMDQVDRHAEAAGSPASPAEERQLRSWFVRSIARQLPAVPGRPPG